MANEIRLILWAWRTIPKNSLDIPACGLQADENTARDIAAQTLAGDDSMISVFLIPLSIAADGEVIRAGKEHIGLRSTTGRIRWLPVG